MKLPTMLDQNHPHTLKKIVKNRLQQKRSQSLTLSPNVKVMAEV